MLNTSTIDRNISIARLARRALRHISIASANTSSAVMPVLNTEPNRTAKLFSPNSHWLMLLNQYPATGFSK
ncbi:hypothetical protein RF55_21688 [Lasius niger]|uniref:Uncharacterized protein n=1 Tax=Lasius niger TaxID=67767 RepID=A0A0J7JY80_LASNI|nr:hypothetical protein RF55_21688 [Lasius niger]